HEQVGGSVAPILAIAALKLARLGWDRRANLADELDRALVETDHWAFRIGRFGIEIEHILHPSNVFGIDLRNAPHVLAPWLQVVFGQAPAHSFPRDACVSGEADQFTRQKLKRPARAARGRARTSGRDQKRFLFARELTARARARLFPERRLHVAEHEAARGPVPSRAAHADARGTLVIAGAGIRRKQNLRALELARRLLATAQECSQLVAFGLVQLGRVEMWRGSCRSDISVSASFVWRCLSGSTVARFPHLAHRTGHADLPHPALGQDLTPSPTARHAQARSDVRARSGRKGARVDRSRPCVA